MCSIPSTKCFSFLAIFQLLRERSDLILQYFIGRVRVSGHGNVFLSIFDMFKEISDWDIGIIRWFHYGIIFSQLICSDVCVGKIKVGKHFEVCTSGMSDIWEVKGLQETLSIYPMTSSTPTLMTELHKLNILVSSSKNRQIIVIWGPCVLLGKTGRNHGLEERLNKLSTRYPIRWVLHSVQDF